MDFLRVGALFIVIAGHWLAIVPYVRNGLAGGQMVYDLLPSVWPVTWIFQVIPLFFFVGGFANYRTYGDLPARGRTRRFVSRRLIRLLVPTLVFFAVWAVIELIMTLLNLGADGPLRGMQLGHITPFAPLWFLGVYLLLVLLAPLTIRLHQRFGLWVPTGLVAGVLAVDLLAFSTGQPAWLDINILLVWLVPHQLGYFYADGHLQRIRRRQYAFAAGLALLTVLLLTDLPVYGRNLLDNGVAVLGTTAPTLPFVGISIAMIAFAMAVRDPISMWLEQRSAWRAISSSNGVIMTLFLWHMTAYFIALLGLWSAGLPLPATPDLTWWLERPLFLIAPIVVLVPLVWLFARSEWPESKRARRSRTVRDYRPERAT